MNTNTVYDVGELAGRVLISAIFILSGFSKIGGYEGTQAYMQAMGVPGGLLPVVILTELGGGLLVLAGFQTRLAALALAGFSVLAGVLFHFKPDDQMQMIMLMKNFAIAGGLLFLVAHGAGRFSIDRWRLRGSAS
jgi:putative oxidoreductase